MYDEQRSAGLQMTLIALCLVALTVALVLG